MRTFTDNAARTWTIALTIDAAKRVKSLLGINLLELESGDPPLLGRLGTDVILLCDCVFALVRPQAEKLQVGDEQFAAGMGGDAILAAQSAFYEELVDFFRKLGRTDLARAVDAQRRMIELAVRRIETRIESLDLEAALETTLGPIPGESSTNWPASSASIPAR